MQGGEQGTRSGCRVEFGEGCVVGCRIGAGVECGWSAEGGGVQGPKTGFSASLFIYLFTCLPIYLFTCLLIYLFTCLLIYLFIYLFATESSACASKSRTWSFLFVKKFPF